MRDGGIYRRCWCCGKSFYCTDGDYTCSDYCHEISERMEDEEDAEEREH